MRTRIFPILWCLLTGLTLSGCAGLMRAPEPSPLSAQLVVVTTGEWSSVKALLQRYERQDPAHAWIAAGEPISAVVGRSGLAWGRGIHRERPAGDHPQKREGDGRAPAGMFVLGPAFGYAAPEALPWVRMPYRQMTGHDRCVDDAASPLYNRLVDEREIAKTWQSDEAMRRDDDQYRLGIVIDHNRAPAVPRGGSCIFLHIWKAPAAGTSGCTAVAAADMETLLAWLKPEANPVIVQLPRDQYDLMRIPWNLP